MQVKVKKLNQQAKINLPAKQGDCGYDVFATKCITLPPHGRFNMPLGIAIEFQNGYFCQVNQKSGLANKYGIDTIGNVIDSGYRGEIHAQLVNTSNEDVTIFAGEKVAQLIFIKCATPDIVFVSQLSQSDRGQAGFGSTGVK